MCPSAFAAMIGKDVRVEDIEHLPDATARANLVNQVLKPNFVSNIYYDMPCLC